MPSATALLVTFKRGLLDCPMIETSGDLPGPGIDFLPYEIHSASGQTVSEL